MSFSPVRLHSDEKVRIALRTPHTHFKRGTPLRIILRDGRHIYDQFEDHGSGLIVLRNYGKIQLKLVKAITIWKRGIGTKEVLTSGDEGETRPA